jgi:hypothetical protein
MHMDRVAKNPVIFNEWSQRVKFMWLNPIHSFVDGPAQGLLQDFLILHKHAAKQLVN